MANKSVKSSPEQWTELDRAKIGEAREVLQSYGLYTDVAEMSDLAYEKRVVRMKALDTVAALALHVASGTKWVELARLFEDYIWEGKVTDADV